MARPSNIDKLPATVREAIGDLRRSGRTIDEILEHLRQLGVGPEQVSRSGLGRHVKGIDEIGEEMRRDRALADALVAKFGQEPDDKLFRANVEMMHGLLFRLNIALREGDAIELTTQDAMFLSSALKNVASAAKTDTERVEKIERRAAEKARREAATTAEAAATAAGLSAERAAEIRRTVLGVRSPQPPAS